MKNTLTTILLLYLFFCLLLFVVQRKLIYFPQPANTVSGVTAISVSTDGARLSGWVVNAEQEKALIYYGGNAESIEKNIAFFTEELPHYSVYLIPYRGYGKSTGRPSETRLYQDALNVFDRVKMKHQRISLMGRSLGSAVATYVAANRPVEKLLLVTPFDSIENVAKQLYWMFPVSLLLKDKFQSISRVQDISVPTYIFIAEQDRVIPRARSERLIGEFREQLVEVIVVSGAGHNNIEQYPEYISGVKRALN